MRFNDMMRNFDNWMKNVTTDTLRMLFFNDDGNELAFNVDACDLSTKPIVTICDGVARTTGNNNFEFCLRQTSNDIDVCIVVFDIDYGVVDCYTLDNVIAETGGGVGNEKK